MLKYLMITLLSMAAFCVKAQTTCKDTIYKKTYVKTWYDYDTITNISTVVVGYDTTFIEKCGRWCKLGVVPPRKKIDKIYERYRRDTSYSYDSTKYTVVVTEDSVGQVCHTLNTIWGIKVQKDNFNNQLSAVQQMGVKATRPNSVGMKGWNGDIGNVYEWYLQGYYTVLNVNWIEDNSQKPFKFVHGADTVEWKSNFEKLCQKGQGGIIDVIAIENEPTNDGYYDDEMTNYIAQLRMAIPIAHKYGIKITDGCIHIELVELVRTGRIGNNKNAPQVKELLDAYKTLDLDYVNVHTSYSNEYPPNMKINVDYIRSYTGHEVISNEYSMVGATPAVAAQMVNLWKSCNMPIVIAWSGDGGNGQSKADAYNIGINLTDIGRSYRDSIK